MSAISPGASITQVIKSVNYFDITIALVAVANLQSNTLVIPAVDLNKSVVVFAGCRSQFVGGAIGASARLLNSTTVIAEYFNATGIAANVNVTGYVLEYK